MYFNKMPFVAFDIAPYLTGELLYNILKMSIHQNKVVSCRLLTEITFNNAEYFVKRLAY